MTISLSISWRDGWYTLFGFGVCLRHMPNDLFILHLAVGHINGVLETVMVFLICHKGDPGKMLWNPPPVTQKHVPLSLIRKGITLPLPH